MHLIRKFFSIFVLTLAHIRDANATDYERVVPFIMGGQKAYIEQNPFMVSINVIITDWLLCSGSIVHSDWVLTAAHCFNNDYTVSELSIRVGATYTVTDGVIHYIKTIQKHPKSNSEQGYDIAMVQTSEEFEFQMTVKAIKLPKSNVKFPPGTNCTAFGYGMTRVPKEDANAKHLRSVEVPIIKHEKCAAQFGIIYSKEKMFCAGNNGSKQSPCPGDFGGPLTCNNGEIYGISVRATSQCDVQGPAAFINVAKHVNWIKNIIEKFDDLSKHK